MGRSTSGFGDLLYIAIKNDYTRTATRNDDGNFTIDDDAWGNDTNGCRHSNLMVCSFLSKLVITAPLQS
jgi:hypothetical protein